MPLPASRLDSDAEIYRQSDERREQMRESEIGKATGFQAARPGLGSIKPRGLFLESEGDPPSGEPTATADPPDEKTVPLDDHIGERNRRQAAEQRVKELEEADAERKRAEAAEAGEFEKLAAQEKAAREKAEADLARSKRDIAVRDALDSAGVDPGKRKAAMAAFNVEHGEESEPEALKTAAVAFLDSNAYFGPDEKPVVRKNASTPDGQGGESMAGSAALEAAEKKLAKAEELRAQDVTDRIALKQWEDARDELQKLKAAANAG